MKRQWQNKSASAVWGLELQPVAKLHPVVDKLKDLGVRFKRVHEDLGPAVMAVVTVGPDLFVLRSIDEDPIPGVTVHTATAGMPTVQLKSFLTALEVERSDVHYAWDGKQWKKKRQTHAA